MKFSIRDLLWLTLLAAVVVAWWIDREQPTALWPFTPTRGSRLVTAEGTITYRGAPLEAAEIAVHYADGNTAVGLSNSAGKFTLTFNGRAGAMPGMRLPVSVSALLPSATQARSKRVGNPHDSLSRTAGGAASSAPRTSRVTIDIPAQGSKQLHIDLK